MDSILSIIKKNFKNKYKKSIYTKKTIKLRDKKLEEIARLDVKRITIKKQKKISKKIYITKNLLINLLSKNLNRDEKKIIFTLYKKFSFLLILREKYTTNIKKITDKKAVLDAYVLLGFLICKLKNINEIKKLNCILKINDITIIKFNLKKFNHLLPFIQKNINYEKTITKKYAKKYLSNFS